MTQMAQMGTDPLQHGPAAGCFRRGRKSSRGATAALPKGAAAAPRDGAHALDRPKPKAWSAVIPVHPFDPRQKHLSCQALLRSPPLLGFPRRSLLSFHDSPSLPARQGSLNPGTTDAKLICRIALHPLLAHVGLRCGSTEQGHVPYRREVLPGPTHELHPPGAPCRTRP